MAVKILLKRGSAQSWATQNPILDEGEIGYEKPSHDQETGNFIKAGGLKIGDGKRHWLDLPYLNKFIITKPSKDKFDYPSINTDGTIKVINTDCLYRADDTKKLYVYNNSKCDYDEIAIETGINETINLLNEKLDEIDKILNKLDKNYGLLNEQTNSIQEQVTDLKTNQSDLSSYYHSLNIEVDEIEDNINYLNKNLEQLSIKIDEQKPSIIVVDTKPETGEENQLYKESDSQLLWHWNVNKGWETVNYNSDVLTEVQDLKEQLQETLTNVKEIDQKIKDFQNSATAQEDRINQKIQAFESTLEEKTTIITNKVDTFESTLETKTSEINSQIEEQNALIAKQLEDQTTAFNSQIEEINSSFTTEVENINTSFDTKIAEINSSFSELTTANNQAIAEIRADFEKLENRTLESIDDIIVRDTLEKFPEAGEDNKLYKALDTQIIYYWDSSKLTYELIKASGGSSAVGGGIIVVETKEELYELEGKEDTLYRVSKEGQFYYYDPISATYEKMGQGGGTIEEGFKMTLSSKIDAKFAITKNEKAILKFVYASVNPDGIRDGVGIGTLTVNDIKKDSVAIVQGDNELDITKHLSLGENTVQLIVMNSEGKQKALVYSIEYADLQLNCDANTMQIQRNAIPLSFKIVGSGEKTIHIQIDDEDPIETNLQSNQTVFSYTIPMKASGDHVLKAYLTREIGGLTIDSNVITIGFISVDDQMVAAAILSIFEETESQQGEVITIPYQVYNPVQQTSDVILTIYDEEENVYFQYERTVTRDLTYWTIQNFPAGNTVFEIRAISNSGEDAIKRFPMTITPSVFDLEVITDNLELEFSAEGRSNDEKNPEQWSYGDVEATFERFAWSNSDGWLESESGETALRFLPGNKMHIPFKPFATDKTSTGYTIELELASRDVADYDAVILSCMNEGRGLEVKSQQATFKSALSEVTMQYKEDERVRITIIVEPLTLTRMMYIFINGVICSVSQYPEDDSFQQNNPTTITIGSDKCGIDLYRLRFYNRVFSFNEQLNNFICDRSTNAERFDAKKRNDIFDLAGNITLNSLPPEIPYLVMQCEELPQFKGDKKKGKSVYFVDSLQPERSFSASNVQFDVQGTSSAGYPIKNFKVNFNDGIIFPNGETAVGYPILEGHLPSKCLCLKADFASSEQANNVMLVEFYERLIKDYFKTPPQEEDSRVRTGIAGRPIVVFWENTTTGEVHFWGQYNMNNDKSNENVFGFDREKYPNLECWEFSNNTSNRCLFIESEYEEIFYDEEKKEEYPAWTADFEARFPDLDDPYRDYTQFKRLTDWLVSTRQDAATNEILNPVVEYAGKTYTIDNAEYRLAKFKNEFDDYFIKDPIIFYYLFTETFLMIDSRAKNMFLTTFDGQHWFPIPYDMDTAIGINNEGKLVFEYDLEDTDYVRGSKVFNGQDSTLWINVRDAFTSELFEMYHELRTNTSNPFSYEAINNLMVAHQEECWPEAIWNADAKTKYIDVFLNTGNNYLAMCQGSKKTQREWWLFNAFKYRDSKYRTGDAVLNSAYCRIYAPADMTVVPYQHLWPRVDFTDSYPVTKRAKRNEEVLLEYPQDTANNTEIYMRSADRMVSFGDLSPYMADEIKFAPATKLQEVILGSDAPGYKNEKLIDISLGFNRLIKYLNIENCVKYGTGVQKTLDLQNCVNLETVKAFNTVPSAIAFPIGGHLKNLYLPGSLKTLTLQKQHMIEHFEMQSYDNLESLWIEDTPGLPIEDMLLNTKALNRVRITNVRWRVSSEENLRTIFNKVKEINGIDVDNSPLLKKPIITGYLEIDSIQDSFLEEINDLFPELIIVVNGKTRFFLRYVNWNNELLYKLPLSQGDNAIDPALQGKIDTPTRANEEDIRYEFKQWSSLPANVQGPQTIVAMYDTYYRVQFLNGDNEVIHTQWVVKGGSAYDPFMAEEIDIPTKTSDVQYHYGFLNWVEDFSVINAPLNVTSEYSPFLRQYKVEFYNDKEKIQESMVYYGSNATYDGDESAIKKIIAGEESPYYEFAYWSPALTEPVVGETKYYAQYAFDGYIKDDWATIVENIKSGNADVYGYGGKKTLDLTYTSSGKEYIESIDMEIIDKNHDILNLPDYETNPQYANLTFKGYLTIKRVMNATSKEDGGANNLNAGGWLKTDMREWLNNDFFNSLPDILKNNIKEVIKFSDGGYANKREIVATADKIFIPSLEELNIKDTTNNITQGQGTPYIMYTDAESRKIDYSYWTRSTYPIAHLWCIISLDGNSNYIGGNSSNKVVFYFCL